MMNNQDFVLPQFAEIEICNGYNFYWIKENSILFWGMDIPIFKVPVTKGLKKFINDLELHQDEVVEIWELEDEVLFILASIGY